MSNADLPVSVDALKPFEQNSFREGRLLITGFTRLAPLLVNGEGEAAVALSFSFDDEKRRIIEGRLSASVSVECQRCLEPMEVELESEFRLGVIDEEILAESLPSELEPIIADGRELNLHRLVEDELIMVLPDFPLHPQQQCKAAATLSRINESADRAAEQARAQKKNPFQVLAGLGSRSDADDDNLE